MRFLGPAPFVAMLSALLAHPNVAGAVEAAAPSTPTAADTRVTAELRSDLERLVEIQQAGSWRIDRYEIEDLMPSTLMSVCRVSPEARGALLTQLDARIVELGGPIEALYEKHKDLGPLKDLLFVTRVRALLSEAMRRAPVECPFYLRPDPNFRGLQGDSGRFSLNLETGGLLQFRRTEGKWSYGGGGVGRLLLSRGFGAITVLMGPEFAGGAMLKTGAGSFVINYFPALPVIVRLHDRSWHYDLEVAPVSLFQADDTRFSFGIRGGLTVGVQSRRTRGVIPWAGATFAYEHYFPGHRPAAEFLRGGLRVGLIWN